MAKGVEDTAYYRYTRFIALNEVGGDPSQFGADVAVFHRAQEHRLQHWPAAMITLSTHDTKRSEDVRASLFALAELPDEWGYLVRTLMESLPLSSRRMGYLLWQTLAGTGFIQRRRIHDYVEKAMREACEETNWIDPADRFEAEIHAAINVAYDDHALRAPIQQFVNRISASARSNSLSQKLIALTMPGVPDVYQGTEVYDDSLVDPDNRRPVDYVDRRRLLSDLSTSRQPGPPHSLDQEKMVVVCSALRARRDRPDLFTTYQPVEITGPLSRYAVGFDRGGAITLATRLPAALAAHGGWDQTRLMLNGTWQDALTGRIVRGSTRVGDVLADLPVALLVR